MTGQNADNQGVQIVFRTDVMPDKAIIHDDETFAVQWAAHNAGSVDCRAFNDLLVITSIPEGCPGSDDQDHPVVYSSDAQGDPQDYMEAPLPAGQDGELMQPTVGPFPAGSYRLTVTLAQGLADTTAFNCVEIIESQAGAASGGGDAGPSSPDSVSPDDFGDPSSMAGDGVS